MTSRRLTAPTDAQRRVLDEAGQRLERALGLWQEARTSDLPRLNEALNTGGIAPIVIPAVNEIRLSGPGASREIP